MRTALGVGGSGMGILGGVPESTLDVAQPPTPWAVRSQRGRVPESCNGLATEDTSEGRQRMRSGVGGPQSTLNGKCRG